MPWQIFLYQWSWKNWNENENEKNWVKVNNWLFFPSESPATLFVLCNWEMIMRGLVPPPSRHQIIIPLHFIIIRFLPRLSQYYYCFQLGLQGGWFSPVLLFDNISAEILHKRQISIRILARPDVPITAITRLISPRLGLSLVSTLNVLFYQMVAMVELWAEVSWGEVRWWCHHDKEKPRHDTNNSWGTLLNINL